MPREEVWNYLRLKEVNKKYIRIIQEMYENCKTKVRCAAGDTDDFHVKVGLNQGSSLSPILFATITDCITGDIQREGQWDMLFADNVVLCGKTREEIEGRLETRKREMEKRGMKMSSLRRNIHAQIKKMKQEL